MKEGMLLRVRWLHGGLDGDVSRVTYDAPVTGKCKHHSAITRHAKEAAMPYAY